MPRLSLRRATEPDLGTVGMISHDAYAPWVAILGQAPLPMTEDYAPRIARGKVWIIERDGRTAGVMVLERARDHLLIWSLAVLPAYQGHGVGRWMLETAEEMARREVLPELRLFTSDRMVSNIELYRRAGFWETGRRPNPYRTGWTLVDMAKSVSDMAGNAGNRDARV